MKIILPRPLVHRRGPREEIIDVETFQRHGYEATALITDVRPPTQSHIGKRANQSFFSACLSRSLPGPVIATACFEKFRSAALKRASASSIPLCVSFVPPDFEMTTTSVRARSLSILANARSNPSGSLLSKK